MGEVGIDNSLRSWRYDNSIPKDEVVVYKFTRRGFKLQFRRHDEYAPLTVNSRFFLYDLGDKSLPLANDICHDTRYKPHASVQAHLLELLEQFSTVQGGVVLREAFQSRERIQLHEVEVFLHEHVCIKGEGSLEGYADFSIYATNAFGSKYNKRPRYDMVEVTIPITCGGRIAQSAELMRVNDDTAIARVLGIVTLKRYERELCLLFVQFMKKETPKEKASLTVAAHIRKYISKMEYVFYGRAVTDWIALYPILTLKGPALNVPDPCHEDYGHVVCMRFVKRGGWWSLEQELFSGDLDVPRYRRRVGKAHAHSYEDEDNQAADWSDQSSSIQCSVESEEESRL
jgi:hypothetical protein